MANLSHIQERVELATALRWAETYGFHEGVCNHFSLAVAPNRFLINPYGWHWSEITPQCLVLLDEKGTVLEGDEVVEDTAFFIHSEIHKAAPQAKCVLHTHMPYATAMTLVEGGRLEMCEQNALMFDGRISYDDDYTGLALDESEGARIARKLGNGSVLMMANHGVTVVGPTVRDAFNDLYYLERAAKVQTLAKLHDKPLKMVSESVREVARQQFAEDLPKVAERHFGALQRMLRRDDSRFAHSV